MLEVHHKNLGAIAVLRLRGQFVNGETEILHEILNSLARVSTVILDLERVTTIDAHGLGVMLEFREQAEARQIRFELTKVSRLVGNVLKLARLDTVFPVRSKVAYLPSPSGERRAPATVLASCA
jgi:anti-anti-sigma factor